MSVSVETLRNSAHYDLRQEYGRWLLVGLLLALALHSLPAFLGPPWVAHPFQLPPRPIEVVEVPVWVPTLPGVIARPDFSDGIPEPVDVIAQDLLVPLQENFGPFRPPVEPGRVGSEAGFGPAVFLGQKARKPEILHRVGAAYPEMARLAEVEGRVVLRVTVGPDGLVSAAEVIESNTIKSLEKAALAAVRQWIFRPAYQGRQPVSVQIRVPFDFRLR